jgi:hypothetical protein
LSTPKFKTTLFLKKRLPCAAGGGRVVAQPKDSVMDKWNILLIRTFCYHEDQPERCLTNPCRRMWINQPSTLQYEHKFHGQNVLAYNYNRNTLTTLVYFTGGEIISCEVFTSALSEGWK